MFQAFPFGKTVTVHRQSPGGVDEYGDPVAGTDLSFPVCGCAVVPRTSAEPTERGRQGVIVGVTLFVPAEIFPSDRVEIDGVMFDVEGEVADWTNPLTGWSPPFEVALRRAEG